MINLLSWVIAYESTLALGSSRNRALYNCPLTLTLLLPPTSKPVISPLDEPKLLRLWYWTLYQVNTDTGKKIIQRLTVLCEFLSRELEGYFCTCTRL